MSTPVRVFVNLTLFLFLLISCSPGSPVEGSSSAAPEASEAPAETNAPQAGLGEIVVEGALSMRFTPTHIGASPFAGNVTIFLQQADTVTGVQLFLPAGIQPGTYAIGDLFNLADADVTARFDTASLDTGFFESTSGSLTLTETGTSFSGSFNFTAVKTPDGSATINVIGNFAGVSATP